MKHVRQRHWAGRWGVLGWPLLGRSQGPVCPLTDHPDRGSLSLQGTQIYTWWGGGMVRDRGWASSPSTALRTHTQSFPLFLKQESRCVRQTDNRPLQGKVCRFLPSTSPLNPRQAGQEKPGSLVDPLILGNNLTTPGSPTG